jgi:hypothetical protein
MSTRVSLNLTWWAVDAVAHYGRWLQTQPYTNDGIRDLYREAAGKQNGHEAELAELLRSTGDAECLACAARYDDIVKAEK